MGVRSSIERAVARAAFWPSVAWNHLLFRVVPGRRYWDAIDEHVVMGAMPLEQHVAPLHALGVRGVVNMCEEYGGPEASYARLGMSQLRLPTIDFTAPSLEDVERGVAFIRAHAARGEKVYVHCKAGRARSATVVLCWLIERRGLSPEDALAFMRSRRRQVLARLHRRAVVAEFIRANAASQNAGRSA